MPLTSGLLKEGIRYGDLTPKQKEYFDKHIWNGVGSREYFLNPHDLIFKEPSKWHDCDYFVGGPDLRRKMADKDFLYRCHQEVKKQSLIKRPFYYVMAAIYHYCLKRFSRPAWELYVHPARNWSELIKHFNSYLMRENLDFPPPYTE